MGEAAAAISIIVPTLGEAENLPLLVPRIGAALAGSAYEILIVDDDSRDGTDRVCAELAARWPLRLIVRPQPCDGLSGAVLVGLANALGQTLVVMDADLQHPPEQVPALIAELERGADMAIGSRYMPGGSTAHRWGFGRRANSWFATLLARPFAGRISDPMSGFFALRRSMYDSAGPLAPMGYKIALELLCKCPVETVREVPIHFSQRSHGQSKLTIKQQFRYLEHLSRLYDYTFPRASPVAKFLIAVALSWAAALAVYVPLAAGGVPAGRAAAVAYLPALAVIAALHARYVRAQRRFVATRRPWVDFVLIAATEWLAVIAACGWLTARLGDAGYVEVPLISYSLATVVRYALRKELLHDLRGLRRDPRASQ